MDSILKTIEEEHRRLRAMLKEFEDNPQNKDELFNKFRLNLDKHFSVEEKGILDSFQMMQGKEASKMFDLIQDHNQLRELVKEIDAQIKTNDFMSKLDEFKSLMGKHERFEEEEFYPMLEETLTPQQISDIVLKCKEIV